MKRILPEALIFDLDGTLWNATPAIAGAWSYGANQLGLTGYNFTPKMIQSIAGLKRTEIFEQVFCALDYDEQQKVSKYFEPLENQYLREQGGVIYPAVIQVLRELQKKFPLFLVSNCESEYLKVFLEYSRLGNIFTNTECFGNTGMPKSMNVRKVLDLYKFRHAWMIGDTLSDWQATRWNNIPLVHASYGFGKVPSAEFVIENFSQINSLLLR